MPGSCATPTFTHIMGDSGAEQRDIMMGPGIPYNFRDLIEEVQATLESGNNGILLEVLLVLFPEDSIEAHSKARCVYKG